MLILSRVPKTEKQRFRVKAVLSTHGEISYVEVSEVDENLLKRGQEIHKKWCRSRSRSDGDGDGDGASMSNKEKERDIFMRAAMQLLNDEHNRSSTDDLKNLQSSHSTSLTLVHPNTLHSTTNNIIIEPHTTSKTHRSTNSRIPYDFFHRRAVALRSMLRSSQSLSGHPLRVLSLSQRIPREESFRYGWLQKACRPSHLTSVGQRAAGGGLWKAKYAELRFSEFIYFEDEHVSSSGSAAGQGQTEHLPLSSSFSPDMIAHDPSFAPHEPSTSSSRGGGKYKRIALSAETCVCRVIKMRDMPCDQGQGDCVFELSIRGAARRIWQAASRADRDEWVAAIHAAMARPTESLFQHTPSLSTHLIGSAGTGSSSSLSLPHRPKPFLKPAAILGLGLSSSSQQLQQHMDYPSSSSSSYPSSSSTEGAAAPFALDIAKYCCIQAAIHKLSQALPPPSSSSSLSTSLGVLSAEGGGIGIGFNDTITTTTYNNSGAGGSNNSAGDQYRDLLYALKALELQVTVPVFFVKSLSVGLTGVTGGSGPAIWEGESTPPATTAITTSANVNDHNHPTPQHDPATSSSLLDHQRRCQAWKDLARDSVRIDGELVSGGEVGAQGVLGAFVRHLVDKCDLLKATAVAKAARSNTVTSFSSARSQSSNSGSGRDNSDSSDNSNGSDLDLSSSSSSFFQLTEAAAVSLAREILSLTNRTETGGDTYFCIDSLLCATTQDRDMCILTPLGAEADPLEVTIDVVEAMFFPKANVDRPPLPRNKPTTAATSATVAGGSISSSSVSTTRRKPQQQQPTPHKSNKSRNNYFTGSNDDSNNNSNSNVNSNVNSNYNSDVDYGTTTGVTAKGENDRGRGGFISRLGLGHFRSRSRNNSSHDIDDKTDDAATLNPMLDGRGGGMEQEGDGQHTLIPSPLRRKMKPMPSPTLRSAFSSDINDVLDHETVLRRLNRESSSNTLNNDDNAAALERSYFGTQEVSVATAKALAQGLGSALGRGTGLEPAPASMQVSASRPVARREMWVNEEEDEDEEEDNDDEGATGGQRQKDDDSQVWGSDVSSNDLHDSDDEEQEEEEDYGDLLPGTRNSDVDVTSANTNRRTEHNSSSAVKDSDGSDMMSMSHMVLALSQESGLTNRTRARTTGPDASIATRPSLASGRHLPPPKRAQSPPTQSPSAKGRGLGLKAKGHGRGRGKDVTSPSDHHPPLPPTPSDRRQQVSTHGHGALPVVHLTLSIDAGDSDDDGGVDDDDSDYNDDHGEAGNEDGDDDDDDDDDDDPPDVHTVQSVSTKSTKSSNHSHNNLRRLVDATTAADAAALAASQHQDKSQPKLTHQPSSNQSTTTSMTTGHSSTTTTTTTLMTVSSVNPDHPGAWLVPSSASSSPAVAAFSKKKAVATVGMDVGNNNNNSNSNNNNSDTTDASASISGGGGGGFLSSLFATPSKKIRAARRYLADSHTKARASTELQQPPQPPPTDRSQDVSTDNNSNNTSTSSGQRKGELCLRISVRSVAKYRLCDSNPQEEADATWAVVTGTFQQSYLLRGNGTRARASSAGIAAGGGENVLLAEDQRLVVSDRVVTIDMG